MPAPMMLAGVYSYDPTVTAFTALSCAYILEAVLNPERRLSWREFAIIMGAFFWGCRIKAVYAPLILMGFLIPADRFETKKKRNWMRAALRPCFCLRWPPLCCRFSSLPARREICGEEPPARRARWPMCWDSRWPTRRCCLKIFSPVFRPMCWAREPWNAGPSGCGFLPMAAVRGQRGGYPHRYQEFLWKNPDKRPETVDIPPVRSLRRAGVDVHVHCFYPAWEYLY